MLSHNRCWEVNVCKERSKVLSFSHDRRHHSPFKKKQLKKLNLLTCIVLIKACVDLRYIVSNHRTCSARNFNMHFSPLLALFTSFYKIVLSEQYDLGSNNVSTPN
jgi:hypothetical protein